MRASEPQDQREKQRKDERCDEHQPLNDRVTPSIEPHFEHIREPQVRSTAGVLTSGGGRPTTVALSQFVAARVRRSIDAGADGAVLFSHDNLAARRGLFRRIGDLLRAEGIVREPAAPGAPAAP